MTRQPLHSRMLTWLKHLLQVAMVLLRQPQLRRLLHRRHSLLVLNQQPRRSTSLRLRRCGATVQRCGADRSMALPVSAC